RALAALAAAGRGADHRRRTGPMGEVIPLRFRPTVVVCVGDEGRAVGAQLATLLPSLDTFRRPGIALLAVGDEDANGDDNGARAVTGGHWLDADVLDIAPGLDTRAGGRLEGERPGAASVPLTTLLVQALRGEDPQRVPAQAADREPRPGVLADATLQRIKAAGYLVPRSAVVVWIAAATASPRIA